MKSVLQSNKECYVCKTVSNLEAHHCLHGAGNRKIADKYGYVVWLCREHHTGNNGVHFDRGLDLHLKRLGQAHFEENHGTREDFIRTFGRSYL